MDKQKLLIMKELIPSVENPGKLKLLVNGKRGETITLYFEDGINNASTSSFVGVKFNWYIMTIEESNEPSNTVVLESDLDNLRIQLQVDLCDVTQIVNE